MRGDFIFRMLVAFQQQDPRRVIVAQTLRLTANKELHIFEVGFGAYIWETRARHDDRIIYRMEAIVEEPSEYAFFLNDDNV